MELDVLAIHEERSLQTPPKDVPPADPDDVFISLLPGVDLKPIISKSEEHFSKGGRRGLSSVFLPKLQETIAIVHYAEAIDLSWPAIALQTMYVWAHRGGTYLGGLRLVHPHTDGNAKLAINLGHPWVWYGTDLDVLQREQHRGVASAMYAHLRAFCYCLGPSSVLLGDGVRLWEQMDPGLDEGRDDGTRAPISPPRFDDDTLNALFAKFGPNAAPDAPTLVPPLNLDHRTYPF